MAHEIILCGNGHSNHRETLSSYLNRMRPQVVGVAAAFVTSKGVEQLINILNHCGNPHCRLIAGRDSYITHPGALDAAIEQGWEVRFGNRIQGGIFHPKIVVAGAGFSRDGNIRELSFVYVGSSNITYPAFHTNSECGHFADAESCSISASEAFAKLWRSANKATNTELLRYAASFAAHNRSRSVSELRDLGVNDSQPIPTGISFLRDLRPPGRPAHSPAFSIAAWAGLQSFTGEFRFQIEFPKNAGRVIYQLIQNNVQPDGKIDVYCPDDETIRTMQYKFYPNNGMSRLNVPNDTPGVTWVRDHKDGIAVVEQGLPGGAPIRIRLIRPGIEANEIVGRSVALGTWGKTPTRSYGWY